MPNAATYPWQWLWDSCFHAVIWAELGDDRGLTELDRLFAFQTESGFVPHMGYHPDPEAARPVWGKAGASTITQPPMYGWALHELHGRGLTPPSALIARAARGLDFLLNTRARSTEGLIELCHPWESGCDDSARWGGAFARRGLAAPSTAQLWNRELWREIKIQLLVEIEVDGEGSAVKNQGFSVASVGFNALVAFNAVLLAELANLDELGRRARELGELVAARYDPVQRTWCDDGAYATGTGRIRTTDALFCVLVDTDEQRAGDAAADLLDPTAYGGAFGPAGAHRDEPTYDPVTYWRGPTWPQMTELLRISLARRGREAEADRLGAQLRRGAAASGLAEFWHPDTGVGGGAAPQSWAGVAVLNDATVADGFPPRAH